MKTVHIRLLTILFIIAACSFFLFYTNQKIQALAFHEVDYSFYIQFSARLLDPSLPGRYNLNPEGGNWLGYSGVEGTKNLHQSLHLELVKYLFALVYRLLPHPLAVFSFIILVFALPAIYLLLIFPSRDKTDEYLPLLFAILYLSFPAAAQTVSFDLRPRTLLMPIFSLAVLAVHFRRPVWERVLFFGLLFLVREEALLLGALVLVYNLLRSESSQDRRRSTLLFLLIWLSGLLGIFIYFRWTGYAINLSESPFSAVTQHPWAWFTGGLIFVLLVLVGLKYWQKIFSRLKNPFVLQLACYCLVFPFLSWPLIGWRVGQEINLDQVRVLVFNELTSQAAYLTAVLILLVLVYSEVQKKMTRRYMIAALGVSAVASLLFAGVVLSRELDRYRQLANSSVPVFELRGSLDRHESFLLADYTTLQAFYDFDRAYSYQRLPWHLAKGNGRYYPENRTHLIRMISNRVDYIVISNENLPQLQALLAEAGSLPVKATSNDRFTILQMK